MKIKLTENPDEEKKKYFKIQANHVAPENAKYSKTNAKLEIRESKKRKREERHQLALRRQTVVKSKSLQHTLLAGAGLQREIGARPHAFQHSQRDLAFVQGLQNSETEIELQGFAPENAKLTDAYYDAEQSRLVLAVRHSVGSHALYSFRHDGDWAPNKTCRHGGPLAAFHEPIRGLQYCRNSDVSVVLAHTGQANKFSGDTYIGMIRAIHSGLDPNGGQVDEQQWDPGMAIGTLKVCPESETMWDCRINYENGVIAAGGTFGAVISKVGRQHANIMARLTPQDSGTVFALDWLDQTTFALGLKPLAHQDSYHDVVLWDIRAQGLAQRIQRPNKILGLQVLDDFPENRCAHNIVVASSHDINLYDLRNVSKDRPVLSLEHKSGSPRVHMSVLDSNLLAASDWNNKVQVYSLREGTHVRTLTPCRGRKGLVSRPRWQLDHRGVPYLQSCVGNTIQRWS